MLLGLEIYPVAGFGVDVAGALGALKSPDMGADVGLRHLVLDAALGKAEAAGGVVGVALRVNAGEHGGLAQTGLAAHVEELVDVLLEGQAHLLSPDGTAAGVLVGHGGLGRIHAERKDQGNVEHSAAVGQRTVAFTRPGIGGVDHLPAYIEVGAVIRREKRVGVEHTVLVTALPVVRYVPRSALCDEHVLRPVGGAAVDGDGFVCYA